MCYTADSGKEALLTHQCENGKEAAILPIGYKVDVLAQLKAAGYSTYKLRKEKILAESTIQALRSGTMVSYEILARLCEMLNCQPGDLLKYDKPDM